MRLGKDSACGPSEARSRRARGSGGGAPRAVSEEDKSPIPITHGGARQRSKLFRPDQHTFSGDVLVIDDEGGTEAFEILGGEAEILEVHVFAVEIDRRAAHLHPHDPERNADPDDLPFIRIERHHID